MDKKLNRVSYLKKEELSSKKT